MFILSIPVFFHLLIKRFHLLWNHLSIHTITFLYRTNLFFQTFASEKCPKYTKCQNDRNQAGASYHASISHIIVDYSIASSISTHNLCRIKAQLFKEIPEKSQICCFYQFLIYSHKYNQENQSPNPETVSLF